MTEDQNTELWRTSSVRRAGWVPVGARYLIDPPGEVNNALQGAIVVAAGGEVVGLEYRWPVDLPGTHAADFQLAMPA